MKTHYLICISLILLTTISINTYSQSDCNGQKIISTDPANPANSDCPTKVNGPSNGQNFSPHNGAIFNWMANTDLLAPYLLNSSVLTNVSSLPSPFYEYNNIPLQRFINQEVRDNLPRDGWELIHQDFGYSDQGAARGVGIPPNPGEKTDYPYIILYNKYTGILRVFLNIGQQEGNTAKLQLTFASGDDFIQTSLLDHAFSSPDKPMNALDDFRGTKDKPAIVTGLSEYQGDGPHWYYADFCMTYDPCTCRTQSKLDFKSFIIKTATISLSGTTTGEILDKNDFNDGKTVTPPVISPGIFDGISSMSIGDITNDAITKASQSYNSISGFIKGTQDRLDSYYSYTPGLSAKSKKEIDDNKAIAQVQLNALEQVLANSTSNSDSPTGLSSAISFLKAAPYIGSALSVIEYLAFGGKQTPVPQKVSIAPMAVNLSTNLSGHFDSQTSKRHITLFNPGSDIPSSGKASPAPEYPYYSQTMGVFNLWKTPSLEFKNVRFDSSDSYFYEYDDAEREVDYFSCSKVNRFMYHMPEDIEYVINKSAGLNTSDEKLDISASVILEFSKSAADRIKFKCEGMLNWLNETTAATPLIPIGCLRNIDFSFAQTDYTPFHTAIARWLWTDNQSGGNPPPCNEQGQVFNQDDQLLYLASPPDYIEAPKVYLKVVANLERLDRTPSTQNVFWCGKYMFNMVSADAQAESYFIPANPVDDHPKTLELNSTTEPNPISSDRIAWQNIVIKQGVSFAGGSPITIRAGIGIEVEAGVEIPPNVILEIGLPFTCSTIIQPKIINSGDCLSNSYQVNRQYSKARSESSIDTQTDVWLSVSPNPSNTMAKVRFNLVKDAETDLFVTDAIGRRILTVYNNQYLERGVQEVALDGSQLSVGVYYLNLHVGGTTVTSKMVILR